MATTFSELAFAELHVKAARRLAAELLERLIAIVPDKIKKVLTGNGTHFTTPGNERAAAAKIKTALAKG